MRDIISSTPAMLLLVVGSYYVGTLLYRRLRSAWVHPVAVGMILTLIVLLLFGGKKLPELMKGLGKGIKGFKDGMKDISEDTTEEKK